MSLKKVALITGAARLLAYGNSTRAAVASQLTGRVISIGQVHYWNKKSLRVIPAILYGENPVYPER